MACIICFLDDSHQISLREELKREDDEFINTLKEYKKIFATEYESLCDVSKCPEHKEINIQMVSTTSLSSSNGEVCERLV